MHRFHFRGFRAWAWLLLLICGAAFAFVQDDRPQYTGAAVGALCAATVLFVVSELRQPADAPATTGATPAVTPDAAADGGMSGSKRPTGRQEPEVCAFCGIREPRTALGDRFELPEGWLALEIDRRAAEVLDRTYCSEEHMRLDLAGPLPAPVPAQEEEPWDGAPLTLGDRLAGLAFGAGLWLLGGFLLLGCVLAVRFLVGLL
ncbi:hypothetical protein ACFV4G_24855 [Kitasatospora sp. NPDC059747]|uniref:hypothetical protein n=1 Tax=Kitasatospora sp. NPDC059747 TaxID=3346930 RepID=UPI00365C9DAC